MTTVPSPRPSALILDSTQVAGLYKPPLKKGHGILKRMVRLSHLWLNEYTTWEEFEEIAQKVLWKYLVRTVKKSLGLR